MKNIFKAALFMLVFAGCSNAMNVPPKTETGLKITIKNDINEARTLYPEQPVFFKYVLELTGEWAWQDHAITLENGEVSKIIPLYPGEWTIKVTGFTKILGNEYAAAEGTKKVIVTDSIAEVSVDISAVQNFSQNGFLYFSASYPEQAVSNAKLYIYHVGNTYEQSRYYWNLKDKENAPPNPIDIEPGYYMMTLMLDVKDSLGNYYRTVTWTEVIHIYSGMETRAGKTFTLDDLNRFITLGGSLNVTINGNAPNEVFVRLYRDANYTDSFGFFYTIADDKGVIANNWQTSIPVLNAPVDFYLLVEASYGGILFPKKLGSVTVNTANIPYPINVTLSAIDTITLNGTANVKINNVAVEETWVVVYKASDIEIGRVRVPSDGSWQMLLSAEYIGDTVSFRVEAKDPAKGYNLSKDTSAPITLVSQNAPITINENFTTIKISGTANITVNGRPPSYASIEVYRRQNTIWAASCAVNPANFSWEISLPVDLINNNLYIRIEGYDYNEKWFSQLLTPVSSPFVLPSSDTTIPPFNNVITN